MDSAVSSLHSDQILITSPSVPQRLAFVVVFYAEGVFPYEIMQFLT